MTIFEKIEQKGLEEANEILESAKRKVKLLWLHQTKELINKLVIWFKVKKIKLDSV